MRFHLVFNPLAGGGGTGRHGTEIHAEILRVLGAPTSTCIVATRDEAMHSTRRALYDGVDTVIVVGGDGTIQNTARGFHANGEPVNPAARMGIVSTGTGRGLAQSLGIGGSIREQLELIATGVDSPVDMVRMTRPGQADARELFINECQFGLGGLIVERVRGPIKRLGGLLAFGMVTVATGLTHRAREFDIAPDIGNPVRRRLLGVVVANGSRMGGGMRLVPGADPADGMLDVLCIHDMPVLERIRVVSRIYDGTHIESDHFSLLSCRRLTISASHSFPVAADGEPLPVGDRHIEVMPGAIRILRGGR